MTNKWRAQIAQKALDLMDDNDHETDACDLLANLMHHARLNGWDFDAALSRATDHFGYEIDGHPDSEV